MWAVAASLTPNELVFKYVYPFSWRALFPSNLTLEAYIASFTQQDMGKAILNTAALSVGTVIVGLLISAMAGFAFAKFEFRGKNVHHCAAYLYDPGRGDHYPSLCHRT